MASAFCHGPLLAGGELLRQLADARRQIGRHREVGRQLVVDVDVAGGGQRARIGRVDVGVDGVADSALALGEIVGATSCGVRCSSAYDSSPPWRHQLVRGRAGPRRCRGSAKATGCAAPKSTEVSSGSR